MSTENIAPAEEQQAPVSLETELGDAFDRIESGESVESEVFEDNSIEEHNPEIDDVEEVEVSAEDSQETSEAAEEGQEEYNEAAPERWNDELKEAYNSLSPAGKQAMLEGVYKPMQRQYTQSTQELAAQRKSLDPMLETLNKYSEDFKTSGVNPVEAFNRQMAWSAHFAKVGAKQGAEDLAKAYGQAGGQHEPEVTAYMTPVEKAQQERLDRIEGQMTRAERNEQARQQKAQDNANQQHVAGVRSSIQQFANEMRDGQPVHPHVEKVSAQMAGLIRGGLVHRADEYGNGIPYIQQLDQAYNIACQMDPSIRSAMDTKTRKQQVEQVTAASRDVVSKTPGHDEQVEKRPLSDSISDLYDRLDRSA